MKLIPASTVTAVVNPFVELWHKITETGPKWLVALAILIVAWLIAKLTKRIVQKAIGRTSTAGHIDILMSKGAAALIFAVGVILALSVVGMSLSAALATLGLASVGIGFALRDVLGNLFAGVVLLMQHPFTIGDQVRVGEQEGVVENVRVRDTQLLTYDGERVFIPNKTVFNSPIINYSSTPSLRQDVRLCLKFADDIDRAKLIALATLKQCPGVQRQPDPVVFIQSEESVLTLMVRFWTETDRSRIEKVDSEVLERIENAFITNGIGLLHDIRDAGRDTGTGEPSSDETQVIDVPPDPH